MGFFRRGLDFDDSAAVGENEVGICIGAGVLFVIQVQDRCSGDDPARHSSDLAGHRHGLEYVHLDQVTEGQGQRDPGAGNRRATGTPVGIQNVAVEGDGNFAHRRAINHRPQGPANQALDFLRAAGLFSACGFAITSCVGSAWQHAVLGGHPAQARVAEERRNAGFDTGGAKHLGIAHADQRRTFRVAGEARGDRDFAEGVGRAAGGAHGSCP
jgi:hypothetical protein